MRIGRWADETPRPRDRTEATPAGIRWLRITIPTGRDAMPDKQKGKGQKEKRTFSVSSQGKLNVPKWALQDLNL
jgi:hypothetical protein